MQRGDGEHVGVPLHHDVRVVSQPDRAVLGRFAIAVLQQRVLPALVHRAAGLAEPVGHTDRLHRVMVLEFPAQVFACDEAAQAGMERSDVVVLQVDLDESLPVVVALVHHDLVQHVAGEVEVGARPHPGQLRRHVHRAGPLFEQQAVPFLQAVVVEVQARVFGEMRRAQQRARLCGLAGAIGPAVQRTDDVAARDRAGQGRAAALENHRLPVPAHVGDQLDAARGSQQRAALALLGQGMVITEIRNRQLVPHITGPLLEDVFHLAPVERFVEVT